MRSPLPFILNNKGFVEGIKHLISPNFERRLPNEAINLIVIHAISMPPDQFGSKDIEKLFMNKLNFDEHPFYSTIKNLKVSAHFLIKRTGELIQFVSCLNKAWHAGQSSWNRRSNCNDFSIGIELEGSDKKEFTEIQYENLNALLEVLCQHYPIQDVVGHSDIAPARKTDPGPFFKWNKIRTSL